MNIYVKIILKTLFFLMKATLAAANLHFYIKRREFMFLAVFIIMFVSLIHFDM